jgi:hypothetical protein
MAALTGSGTDPPVTSTRGERAAWMAHLRERVVTTALIHSRETCSVTRALVLVLAPSRQRAP